MILFNYRVLTQNSEQSLFTYNIVSYINRITHEPQTLGELFRELECELVYLCPDPFCPFVLCENS